LEEECAREAEGESGEEGDASFKVVESLKEATADEADKEAVQDETPPLKLHNVHDCIPAEIDASADPDCSCDKSSRGEKLADDACMAADARSSPMTDSAPAAALDRRTIDPEELCRRPRRQKPK
jgi:hypothetical protein